MTKKYQTTTSEANALAVPEQVSVSMEEIAADMPEGLLAHAPGAGLKVMAQLMETDVIAVCGPRGKHDPDRTATRHGTEAGSVTLDARRVPGGDALALLAALDVEAIESAGRKPAEALALLALVAGKTWSRPRTPMAPTAGGASRARPRRIG